MLVKPTASMDIAPEMHFALGFIQAAWARDHLSEPTVTSAKDSHENRPKSLHNGPPDWQPWETENGLAVDIRTRDITFEQSTAVVSWLRANLDPLGFDTVLESNHIHCEFDPKGEEAIFKRGQS